MSGAAISAVADRGIPRVLTLHDYGLWCRLGTALHGMRRCGPTDLLCRLHERVQQRVTAGVSLVIGPSRFVLDAHRRRGFFRTARAEVLPIPIERGEDLPRELHDTFQILYLGQLVPHKGVEVLLQAFLAEPDRTWRLQILGRGPLRQRLEQLSASDPRVSIGQVSPQERSAVLSQADLLVVPSLWDENAPLVVVEAFQAGLPVVASRVGGLPELVRPGFNGDLVPLGDPGALRAALRLLADHPARRAALSLGARRAWERHRPDHHISSLLSWYLDALPGAKQTAARGTSNSL
jgi:glycosyltransferase involved in cell wall biosynthesis